MIVRNRRVFIQQSAERQKNNKRTNNGGRKTVTFTSAKS